MRSAAMVTDDPLAAARAALDQQAWQDALDEARAATVVGAAAEAERLDLAADAAWWLGRLDECIESREAAYLTYDEFGDDLRAGQCAVWLWEHHAISARPSVAGAWLRRARRSLDRMPESVEYGNLILREAETAHGSGELDLAVELTSTAVSLGRRLRSVDLEAEALQAKGRVLIDQGHLDDGMGHLDEAMLFAVEGRLRPFSTGKVYCSLIAACEDVGDFNRASEWTQVAMQWAQRHPFAIFPGICRVHHAVVLKRRGSLAEAELEAARACHELSHSHVANSAAAWAEVGDIRRRLGHFDRAEEAFARAQQLSGKPCGGLALLRLANGHLDDAMSIITGCVEGQSNPLARAGLLPVLVHTAIAAGDLDRARRAASELEETADTFATASLRASADSTRGRLQLAEGDLSAPRTLQRAADRWHELGVPYEEATALTLLGQAYRAMGDDASATRSFESASLLFAEIGASLDAGQAVDGTRPRLPSGLTEREVEVLRLVANGLRNAEIAAELFLSVKTVSRHISNIYAKIGVSSRAAATAFAFENDLVTRQG